MYWTVKTMASFFYKYNKGRIACQVAPLNNMLFLFDGVVRFKNSLK